MSHLEKQTSIKTLLIIALGVLIEACAITFFIFPNQILTGGTAGVSVALEPLIHVNPLWMSNILVVGLFILGYFCLGKQFAMKSFAATVFYPIFMFALDYVYRLFPADFFIMPDYLASIYSGIFVGIGLGLVFYANASTGGMDILALLIHKYLKVKEGDAVTVVDGMTVILGIFTYGLAPALVGMISVYVCGYTINRTMMLNASHRKELMIISDRWNEIREYVLNEIDRGLTYWKGFGGYTQDEKVILMCIIDQKEYPQIEAKVMEIDPLAFIAISDVHKVHGEGFTFRQSQRLEQLKKYEA
ncbi:MAG: YitT family protein [Erysipelotrichaceae bacterium]|nr:YitT family protein [Erysipelotrichaceae bacterium]